ncbi:hypothetical protein J437_LFUL016377 [Ladona fulva]|uniref:Serine protease HTRA2, mitochondrial n=1 Tax=Ladona fulva TaxID=123851 RepID=A0A8K0KK15_LADFU|nr:hypothetical protein J437_LFUL016377 [Ladona fulva]
MSSKLLFNIFHRNLSHCKSVPTSIGIHPCIYFLKISKRNVYSSLNANRKQNARNNSREYGALVFAFGIGFGLSWVFKEKSKLLENCSEIFPNVLAAKTFDPVDPPEPPNSSIYKRFNFIADVVEKCAPSVVFIEIKDHRRLDFFSGRSGTASTGSGFIVHEDGLILTNAHVVIDKPNCSVQVKLQDGQTFTGVVENVDLKSDLATVRIPCVDFFAHRCLQRKLPVMPLGTSSKIRPGEWVVAIGSPLSLSNTITAGVVSSANRGSAELGMRGVDMQYIQTDAAITFGNSGGPLVNLNGEAIGINSMKVTPGISFAIPIDYAKEFLKKTAENGPMGSGALKGKTPARRRFMGITMLTLTQEILVELQQRNHQVPPDVSHGILVWKVVVGSPAYNAGLRPGDIVTIINGKPVHSAQDVYKALDEEGDLRLKVIRPGSTKGFDVVVRPED